MLTVFKLSDEARDELVAIANGEVPAAPVPEIDELIVDPLADYESVALCARPMIPTSLPLWTHQTARRLANGE